MDIKMESGNENKEIISVPFTTIYDLQIESNFNLIDTIKEEIDDDLDEFIPLKVFAESNDYKKDEKQIRLPLEPRLRLQQQNTQNPANRVAEESNKTQRKDHKKKVDLKAKAAADDSKDIRLPLKFGCLSLQKCKMQANINKIKGKMKGISKTKKEPPLRCYCETSQFKPAKFQDAFSHFVGADQPPPEYFCSSIKCNDELLTNTND